jgi:hypothetical protein
LSHDLSVPKYATHLVYLTSADNPKEIEHKIIYSILSGKPKRADIYWFVHVHTVDEPHTSEYMVKQILFPHQRKKRQRRKRIWIGSKQCNGRKISLAH